MQCVAKVPELNTLFFVGKLENMPLAPEGVEIEEGAWVEVPEEIVNWPVETVELPPRTLGVCKTNPKHYREFIDPKEVEKAGFQPTEMIYGGAYSPRQWERLAERIPALRAFEAIQCDERPGAMDEAMRSIREAC